MRYWVSIGIVCVMSVCCVFLLGTDLPRPAQAGCHTHASYPSAALDELQGSESCPCCAQSICLCPAMMPPITHSPLCHGLCLGVLCCPVLSCVIIITINIFNISPQGAPSCHGLEPQRHLPGNLLYNRDSHKVGEREGSDQGSSKCIGQARDTNAGSLGWFDAART